MPLHELNELVTGWRLQAGEMALEAWAAWKDYRVLPFTGGWLEQPAWVRGDFQTLDLLYAWHIHHARKPHRPQDDTGGIHGRK